MNPTDCGKSLCVMEKPREQKGHGPLWGFCAKKKQFHWDVTRNKNHTFCLSVCVCVYIYIYIYIYSVCVCVCVYIYIYIYIYI
jgi:hypothetical protein